MILFVTFLLPLMTTEWCKKGLGEGTREGEGKDDIFCVITSVANDHIKHAL